MELTIDVGVPAFAAVVDDEGRYAGLTPPILNPTVTFTPRADFCALPVSTRMDGAVDESSKRAFLGRTYVLRIVPVKPPSVGQQIRITSKVMDWDPDAWRLTGRGGR
jgi:hypothetical protein